MAITYVRFEGSASPRGGSRLDYAMYHTAGTGDYIAEAIADRAHAYEANIGHSNVYAYATDCETGEMYRVDHGHVTQLGRVDYDSSRCAAVRDRIVASASYREAVEDIDAETASRGVPTLAAAAERLYGLAVKLWRELQDNPVSGLAAGVPVPMYEIEAVLAREFASPWLAAGCHA